MSDMSDMTDLIAQLEAASEGSRELDEAIARAIGWACIDAGSATAAWLAPDDDDRSASDGECFWKDCPQLRDGELAAARLLSM